MVEKIRIFVYITPTPRVQRLKRTQYNQCLLFSAKIIYERSISMQLLQLYTLLL